MQFEIGDKVVVKLTNEDAQVVEIINDKMVMIEVKGVKFPAYSDQIEYPYFKRFMEAKKIPAKRKKSLLKMSTAKRRSLKKG